jgi:predicted dinucleotide-binding enzyme
MRIVRTGRDESMKVAILGTGNVGKALQSAFSKAKCDVRLGSRTPDKDGLSQREAVAWGEIVVLAVPYNAVEETVNAIGASRFEGKIVLDVTNPLNQDLELALGFSTSAGEETAKLVPGAKVVKAFNTVFAANQSKGKVVSETLTLFVAGDDEPAKKAIMDVGARIGFDPVDVGPLKAARYLEPMAVMLIGLGYGAKMGTDIGYRLVRGK